MVEINKDQYLKTLKDLFPNKAVSFIAAGWTSMAFDLDNTHIIRIPLVNMEQYKKEATLLAYLKGKISTNIPNPKIVESPEISYAIHKKIIGNSWDNKSYNQQNKETQDRFCKDIATFFYELHSIDVNDLYLNVNKDEYEPYPLDKKELFLEYLKDELNTKEITKLYDFTQSTSQSKEPDVLLHKDFSPYNSLINNNHQLSGVFDFANAGVGDAHQDFRPLYHKDFLDILENIIKHYQNMGGQTINIQKLIDLQDANVTFCIQYLAQNPHLIKADPNNWQKQISIAKEAISKI